MSRFFCDTNCELDLETFKSLNIELIKMPYSINGDMFYYDLGENTDIDGFFEKMKSGAQVKTQALNPYDYIEYFEPVMAGGEDIVYVSFSHKLSGTFESLNSAIAQLKEKFPERKVTVINSCLISVPAGIVVFEAAKKHNEGATDEEVAQFVETLKKRTTVYFTVDSLEYLRRGGRLTKFKFIFGTLLNIKPIIMVDEEGKLVNTEALKGRKLALKKLAQNIKNNPPDLEYRIFVIDAACPSDADSLCEMINEDFPNAQIRRQKVGPVIGSHCGPGTIGLAYVKKV